MSSQFSPLISCIVPCFNENIEILKISLGSLRDQSFTNFECIVIDESTNEEIADACKKFCESDKRFAYIRPVKRIGLAASLNMGIQIAKGLLIARFDSDDICHIDRLRKQIEFLNANPEVSVLGSAIEIIDGGGKLIGFRAYPLSHADIKKKFIFSSALAHPAVMFRREILGECGGAYDPSFTFSEDLDLWLRLLKGGVKFANLPDALVQYRQDRTSRNKNHWKFNIKARLKNISGPYFIAKLMGISGIWVWSHLPRSVQQFLFRRLQLRHA